MNESINIPAANTPNKASSGVTSSPKATASVKAGNSTDDASYDEDSFSESLTKAGEVSGDEKAALDAGSGGKSLPESDETRDAAAKDDPTSLAGIIESVLNTSEFNLTGLDIASSDVAADTVIDINDPESAITNAGVLATNIMSSTMSQLRSAPSVLNIDTDGDAVPSSLSTGTLSLLQSRGQGTGSDTAGDESINLTSKLDTSLTAQSTLENPEQISERAGLLGRESGKSTLSLTGQQAQQLTILTELQGQVSQRVDVSSVVPGINSLNVPLSQPANASPLSLQALPQMAINQTFGDPAWSQEMGKQVIWMANQNIKSAEIRLNPAHLGPVEVRLEISDDQINVALSSRHAIVREAMDSAMPKLREMFDENGLNLAGSDISQHSFAEQREQQAEGQRSQDLNNRTVVRSEHTDLVEEVVAQQKILSSSQVDYFI